MNGKPETGYDFDAKRIYREQLWKFFDAALVFVPRRKRRVLILDTSEALETQFLISKGYEPSNITVINKSAAHLAWLSRRIAPHRVNTVATDVFDFLEQHYDFHAVNLDLTCPLSGSLIVKIKGLKLRPNTALSVSILRGRETDSTTKTFYQLARDGIMMNASGKSARTGDLETPNWMLLEGARRCVMNIDSPLLDSDVLRILNLTSGTTRFRAKRFVWGRYKSTAGSQTMMWGAQLLGNHH